MATKKKAPAKAKKAVKKAASKPAQAPAASAQAPQASTAVLDAILKATGEKAPGKGETLQQFVERACTAITGLDDDAFGKMTSEAPESKKWYEDNLALFNDEKFDKLVALPGMPGYSAPEQPTTPAAPAEPAKPDADKQEKASTPTNDKEQSDMATKKKAGKKSGQSTPKAPKADKSNGNGERALRTDSVSYQVRQAVVKNPDIAFDKLCEKLGIKGKDASPTGHVHNMFQHAKIVMKIAAAEGYAK